MVRKGSRTPSNGAKKAKGNMMSERTTSTWQADAFYEETISEWGQSACLLTENRLTGVAVSGEALLNQTGCLPPFWNGLLVEDVNQTASHGIRRLPFGLAGTIRASFRPGKP
jgi:hypothetical protein